MEIEKVMTILAPAAKVWEMILDPKIMAGCAPGMKSIEVISPTEYVAVMQVKISFISAKFKLNTKIVEQRAPYYLRSEGTGEDTSVASSMKQQSEIFLTELPDGSTELKMKARVEVLGRLGSFGLSVMKTKADRMWEEFGQNLKAKLEEGAGSNAAPEIQTQTGIPAADAPPAPISHQDAGVASAAHVQPAAKPEARQITAMTKTGWLDRLLGRNEGARIEGRMIRIEIKRADSVITVHWPLEAAGECAVLLREALEKG